MKRFQGFVAGALVCAVVLLMGNSVLASNLRKTIDIVYRDIKLVVDGELVEPKDANGNTVEPFIYNGTTYLPVRAVSSALDKEVAWDGDTSTVYIGGETEKAAKAVYLYDKPYASCSEPRFFFNEQRNDGTKVVGFTYSRGTGDNYSGDGEYLGDYWAGKEVEVVYTTNGLAQKIEGRIDIHWDEDKASETYFEISDESGNILYKSPIMNQTTEPVEFSVDCSDTLQLKIKMYSKLFNNYSDLTASLEDLRIITTDY